MPLKPTNFGANNWQVFFNRLGALPLVCSIMPEERDFEVNVQKVHINVPSETIFVPKEVPDDEDGLPSFWILATGELFVADGVAHISNPGRSS